MTARVVGRAAELGAVAALLTSARAEPSCLQLEGEPGMGKTTVWSAALDMARDRGFHVLSTRPAAVESVLSYASLADLLSGVDASLWADIPVPQRLALDRVLLRAGTDGVVTDPRAVATGLSSVIDLLSALSPVLLAVDDMQWLDSSSAAALTFIVRRLTGPVAFLGTTRIGADDAEGPRLHVDGLTDIGRVRLRPLSLDATRTVLSQGVNRSFGRPTMVRIHELSGGNPFYAMELARAVVDEPNHVEMALPTTLSELVQAKTGSLSADLTTALLAAAAVPSPTIELIARAVGSTAAQIAYLMESPEAKGIVTLHGAALRFAHPLLAWGVYSESEPAQRRALHRRLSDLVDDPELRARHLALAATGPDPTTVAALDAGAELALVRGAPAAAAELLALAIELGADTPQRRMLLAINQFTAGDSAAARTQLDQVVASPLGGAPRAEALVQLAVLSLADGSWATGAELLERALDEAEGEPALCARILLPLSLARVNGGLFDMSASSIADAVANATALGDRALTGQALSMQVVVECLRGNGFDEQTHIRAVALEQHDPPAWVQLRPSVHHASLLAWTGRLDAAHHAFIDIRRDLIERGEESELMFVVFQSVLAEIWRADFATARAVVDDAVERAMHLAGVLPLGVGLMLSGMLDAYAGREADARQHVADATEAIRLSGSNYLMSWLASAVGLLEVSLGNYESAVTALEPARGHLVACPRGTEIFVAGFAPDLIEAMIHTGRLRDAEEIISIIEANGRRLDRAWMLAVAARGRAMLLAASGDVVAAATAADDALREHLRLPMPFEYARTLLLLGQIRRRQRLKDAAAAALEEALDVFEELGTPLWADRARLELSRAKARAGGADELTASERRVAELLASGMTRREVAAALFISPKTVEAHLGRVYRKLGIRSRAELGRYVANS